MNSSSLHNPSVFHRDYPVRYVEVPIVVGNGNDGLSLPFEVGKDFMVEAFSKGRILFRGPFVKQ